LNRVIISLYSCFVPSTRFLDVIFVVHMQSVWDTVNLCNNRIHNLQERSLIAWYVLRNCKRRCLSFQVHHHWRYWSVAVHWRRYFWSIGANPTHMSFCTDEIVFMHTSSHYVLTEYVQMFSRKNRSYLILIVSGFNKICLFKMLLLRQLKSPTSKCFNHSLFCRRWKVLPLAPIYRQAFPTCSRFDNRWVHEYPVFKWTWT
jgi:hypothetical protein